MTFQNNQSTQTFPQQNTQAIQTDLGLNENLTLDSTASSPSTDLFDETVSINNFNSNRKRKVIKTSFLINVLRPNKGSR